VKRTDNEALRQWVYLQKKTRDTMPSHQRQLLEQINFSWELKKTYFQRVFSNRITEEWMRMFNELKQFHEIQGHCYVPSAPNIKLYNWVCKQRGNKRAGIYLNQKQIEMLDQLGFPWDVGTVGSKVTTSVFSPKPLVETEGGTITSPASTAPSSPVTLSHTIDMNSNKASTTVGSTIV
jgi:hypothetical protein